jgi:hypothetical protein
VLKMFIGHTIYCLPPRLPREFWYMGMIPGYDTLRKDRLARTQCTTMRGICCAHWKQREEHQKKCNGL